MAEQLQSGAGAPAAGGVQRQVSATSSELDGSGSSTAIEPMGLERAGVPPLPPMPLSVSAATFPIWRRALDSVSARPSRFSHQAGAQPGGAAGDPGGDRLLAGLGLRSGGESLARQRPWMWRVALGSGQSSVAASEAPNKQGEACGLTSRAGLGSRRRRSFEARCRDNGLRTGLRGWRAPRWTCSTTWPEVLPLSAQWPGGLHGARWCWQQAAPPLRRCLVMAAARLGIVRLALWGQRSKARQQPSANTIPRSDRCCSSRHAVTAGSVHSVSTPTAGLRRSGRLLFVEAACWRWGWGLLVLRGGGPGAVGGKG